MSVNKARPHVMILPEDDANRQVANGFVSDPELVLRAVQVLPPTRGWIRARETFEREHVTQMQRWPCRHLVILVDFDRSPDRRAELARVIPDDLADRVIVLGAWSEPEELRSTLGGYEAIGRALAEDCRVGVTEHWQHPLLSHNQAELDRIGSKFREICFSSDPPPRQ